MAARDDVEFSVSVTTRRPRDGERDGVDYLFLSRDEFQRRIDRDEFLEWAEYGGELYGTLRSEVERVRRAGKHAVLDIEIQGARIVRERTNQVVSIFILPPSVDALLKRLRRRADDAPEVLAVRLQRAVDEIREALTYDYVVINDDRTQAVADVAGIIEAEAHHPERIAGLGELLEELRQGLGEAVKQLRKPKESS